MAVYRTKKFDIASKLAEKRDGKFHFTDVPRHQRKAPRKIWWTIMMLIIILLIFFYLKRMM